MGTVNAAGKTGAVQLAVICTEKDPLRVVQGELRVELRLRSSLVPPPSGDFGCDGDIDGSNAGAHTKIGSGEEWTENVCTDDVPENPSAIQTIQIDGYSIPHARALLGAAGQELTLSIGKEGVPQRDLVAKFQLPPDAVALQTMAESCLQAQSSREEAEAKATLVSCPATPDAELTEAQVLTGAGMKPFAPDADNDIGTAWYLPKSTKQHPVRQRMTLVCLYKKPDGSAARQTFPIPPKANDCVARHDDEAGNLFARCE